MRCTVALVLLLSVVLASSCDGVFVGGFTNFTSSVTGTVSIVRLTVTDNGVQITFVTLLQNFGAQDLRFCGNVANQFPINSTVTVRFTPGTPCDNNVVVVVIF